ncbi:MAG: NAD(P)H-binding protein [Isosphaeraceae bacterium]|nr:NAD(P)H-binding protein [Isosphaeraceae bacterium]
MKPSILIQLDTDPQPSVFDAVVAIDAGVDHLLRHGGVEPEAVRNLVYGALFTRGPADLNRTAIFIGGSDVGAGEAVLKAVRETFFGPFRVSVLLDANGANTTAAAAVLAAIDGATATRGSLNDATIAVLGATGPVGQRVARLLLRLDPGVQVRVGSRRLDRAQATAASLREATGREAAPFATAEADDLARGLEGAEIVIAAGAAGATLLPESIRRTMTGLKVLIDLNAVPPAGIEGVEPADKKTNRDGLLCWGALGVGGTKMKIHKKAIQELFTSNDKVLDAEECLALGRSLG